MDGSLLSPESSPVFSISSAHASAHVSCRVWAASQATGGCVARLVQQRDDCALEIREFLNLGPAPRTSSSALYCFLVMGGELL